MENHGEEQRQYIVLDNNNLSFKVLPGFYKKHLESRST
jgi:hypothetical protein